jgi:hypothetical protein
VVEERQHRLEVCVMGDKAFQAMPYRAELRWVRNAIAAACRRLRIELVSVDEQIAVGDVIAGIHDRFDLATSATWC